MEPEVPLSHLGMRHTFYDESALTQIYHKVIYDDWSDHSQSPHRVQKNIHCFCFVLFCFWSDMITEYAVRYVVVKLSLS